MFRITTKSLGRVAVAALLSAGLTAGTVGVASASSRHNNDQSTQSEGNFVAGTVSSYAAGTSIAVTPKGATSPTTYTLNSSTAISGLQSGATIASPDFVVLELSASTPVTVTAIRVFAPRPTFVAGTVSSYAAGTSIAVTPKGATSPTTYTLNSSTAISGLQSGATIASPDFVVLELSASTPVTVTAIRVFAPRPTFVAGTVSSYAAGTSIAVTPKGATSPTTYTLNSSTAISGLQSGATIASPDFVVLELSASTPVTVTAIRVFAPQSGNGWGSGDQSPGGSSNRGGFGGPGAQHSGGFGGRDSHNGGRGNHGFARNGNFRK